VAVSVRPRIEIILYRIPGVTRVGGRLVGIGVDRSCRIRLAEQAVEIVIIHIDGLPLGIDLRREGPTPSTIR